MDLWITLAWKPLIDITFGFIVQDYDRTAEAYLNIRATYLELKYETGSELTLSSVILFRIEFSTIFCFDTERIEI